MDRVSVVGCTGSGKTMVAGRIAEIIGAPHLELDSVFHRPDWTPLPDDQFQARVDEFIGQVRWVVDGNYTSQGVAGIVWPPADTIVWLDLPRSTVMRRVIKRTFRRVATREILWNGNREPWSNFFDPRPEKNIITWTWTRHHHVRRMYQERSRDGTWAHTEVHRLRSQAEVDSLLAQISSAPGS